MLLVNSRAPDVLLERARGDCCSRADVQGTRKGREGREGAHCPAQLKGERREKMHKLQRAAGDGSVLQEGSASCSDFHQAELEPAFGRESRRMLRTKVRPSVRSGQSLASQRSIQRTERWCRPRQAEFRLHQPIERTAACEDASTPSRNNHSCTWVEDTRRPPAARLTHHREGYCGRCLPGFGGIEHAPISRTDRHNVQYRAPTLSSSR